MSVCRFGNRGIGRWLILSLAVLFWGGAPVRAEAGLTASEDDTVTVLYSDASTDLEAFVTRFYHECLDRAPDPEGLAAWVNALKSAGITGADLAEGFILGPEFENRGTSDETFLVILYRVFFDRAPDAEGFDGWMRGLEGGMPRARVLDGFVRSEEFAALCRAYGITPYVSDPVEAFVTRFYRECLNRSPDPGGLAAWVNGLKSGSATGADLAEGFVLSPEFTQLGLSNEAFVEILYRAFFNRAPDTAGYNGWLSALRNGMQRAVVLERFIVSEEFIALCRAYGINAFDPNAGDNDGDGYAESQGDCDDTNPGIHPGAAEICGDGIDQDCNGSDLPCAAPPECANIAGTWSVSETATVRCCIGSECESETISGSDTVTMRQQGCRAGYEVCLPGYGCYERSGTVTGNTVSLSGPFLIMDPAYDCNIAQNILNLNGTLNGNRISFRGSGRTSGSCEGMTFSCTGETTAEFTKTTAASLSGFTAAPPGDSLCGTLFDPPARIFTTIVH